MTTPVLTASRLVAHGFRHGFSTRAGGVSEGPFDSLNLGAAVGDDPDRVRTNHQRLARAVGYDPARLHQTSQVHGADVAVIGAAEAPDDTRAREADALVCGVPEAAVAVRVADCVPVLLADPEGGVVAAAHAGWRGVAKGVLGATVRAMGVPAGRLVAAVGPSIGPCCFEVGDDVAAEIAAASEAGVVRARPGRRPHVDLWRAVGAQLAGLGVTDVEVVGRCTVCESEGFFSFRRDGARSGRMVGVLVARGR